MIGVLGINYKTASLEIRENFSFQNSEIQLFAEELQKQTNISDIVLLSTCNRTEIYFSQHIHDECTASILVYNCLLSFKKIVGNVEKNFYSYSNDEAVAHLFRVCAGMDSMIVGEDQIIGQVKEAYLYCTELALTDAVLMRLFQKSFEAGKKVRTYTGIKTGITSMSYAAIEMCSKLISISNSTLLLIGTGDTGKLALQGFSDRGISKIFVSNRTPENAEDVIQKYSAEFIPISDLHNSLHKADIIITSTNAGHIFISKDICEIQAQKRNHKQQIYIDLSVPRNIEPTINEIDSITLISVDDIQEIIEINKDKRSESLLAGNEIINELTAEFMEWLSFRSLQPAIRAINFNLQKISRDEIRNFTVDTNKDIPTNIHDFSEILTQKYSKELIKNLKDITDNGRKELYIQVINDLFKIRK